jgi:hypothetical protein
LILLSALVGALGGWTGGRLQTLEYTATSYAVVYPMPQGLRNLISPDEANVLQDVYQAGALQDAVIDKTLPYFPGMSAKEVRDSVQIAIVAYSPYTRVIATARDPLRAVALANNISDNWTLLITQAYESAFSNLTQRLTEREHSVDAQVTALLSAIATQQAAKLPNPAVAQALQAELVAAQQQQQDLLNVLQVLSTYHNNGEGVAYTATRATERGLEAHPDSLHVTLIGATVGLVSGLLLALWRMRRMSTTKGRPRASGIATPASPAEGWR